MSVSDLIVQAKNKKAQSINFVVGSLPQVQILGDWATLRQSPFMLSEWNILLQSILSPHQVEMLDQQGSLVGEGLFGNSRIGFSFFQSENIMKVWLNLELEIEKSVESFLPPVIFETALRKKGMILLSGSSESNLTQAAYSVLHRMNSEKPFSAVVFSSQPFPKLKEDKGLFVYSQVADLNRYTENGLTAGVDVVLFHGYSDEKSFSIALQLAEKGVLVIYSMQAPSIMNSLRRVFSFVEKAFGKHGSSRLAEVMELALCQISMKGTANEVVHAYEVLLMKEQIRQLVQVENLSEIESLLKSAPENSGLMSLNQALLQNLVRRKIDIKTAFEFTRDPDSLDALLKKVGI